MSWADTILRYIGLGRYTSVQPNLQDGEFGELRVDQNGRLLVSTQQSGTLWNDGGVSAAFRVVKNSAGVVYQLFGLNTGGSTRYLFIYDAASKPADGATGHIFAPLKIDAGEWFSLDIPRPRSLTQGLTWVVSSTPDALTYASGSTFQVTAEYS